MNFDKKTGKEIFEKSIHELKFIIPIFFVAVLVGVVIEAYIPNSIVSELLNTNLFISIPFAAIIGILLPIPRYATYPIAFALFMKGAGVGVIFALIGGEVICESIARDVLEIKYLGGKFFLYRLLLSVFFISLGGFAMEAIM